MIAYLRDVAGSVDVLGRLVVQSGRATHKSQAGNADKIDCLLAVLIMTD